MPDDLSELISSARDAVDSCRGLVDEEHIAQWESVLDRLTSRNTLGFHLTTVGILGGTGSGKSSLLNSLVGAPIADVGGIRPTTSVPMAASHPDNVGHLERYFSDGKIEFVADDDLSRWVCLIDMPDIDSIEIGNRQRVDDISPALDFAVVVTDPEKYRDRVLHDQLVASLHALDLGYVVVLNQVDRMTSKALEDVEVDLRIALAEDESEAPVVLMSADPPSGPPVGLDDLWREINAANQRSENQRRWKAVLVELAASMHESVGTGPVVPATTRASVHGAANQLVNDGPTAAMRQLLSDLEKMTHGLPPGCRGAVGEVMERLPTTIRQIDADMSSQEKSGFLGSIFRGQPDKPDPAHARKMVEERLDEEVLVPLSASLTDLSKVRTKVQLLMADIAGHGKASG